MTTDAAVSVVVEVDVEVVRVVVVVVVVVVEVDVVVEGPVEPLAELVAEGHPALAGPCAPVTPSGQHPNTEKQFVLGFAVFAASWFYHHGEIHLNIDRAYRSKSRFRQPESGPSACKCHCQTEWWSRHRNIAHSP